MMQKDESCDACERLLPCGPARGDVQYLILCKGKHTTHARCHRVAAHPVDDAARRRRGRPVRRRAARRGVRWARRRRGDAAISEHPPASGSRPVNEKKAFCDFPSVLRLHMCDLGSYNVRGLQICSARFRQGDALSSQWTNDALPDDLPGTQLGHARTGRSSYAPPMCPIEATAAIATCCT